MKLRSMSDVASRAEHLHGEQLLVQNEVWDAQRQSDAAAGRYSMLSDRLRSLPSDTDPYTRASIELQINRAIAEYESAQSSLAQAEARQEQLDREIAGVAGDAREYLRSVEGNIEAARGASKASGYGASAIAQLISGFERNKGLAEHVLQLLGSAGDAGGAGLLGGAPEKGVLGWGVALGDGDESIIHIHGNEIHRRVDFLPRTNQGFQTYTIDGQPRSCFNAPVETGKHLNYHQGSALHGFGGTCGIVACENIARMAGKRISEAEAITVATNHDLCLVKWGNRGATGGTCAAQRQRILASLGIDSYLDGDLSVDNIASAVESGRGVIASVDAGVFWNDSRYSGGGHAITVTSVERDMSGNVTAFFVCDSGSGADDYARRVDVGLFSSSLLPGRQLNVTTGIIR